MTDVPRLRETALRLLSEACASDEVKTQLDLPMYDAGLIDSFGTISLILAVDAELGIKISPADLDVEAWTTPRKFVEDLEWRAANG